MKKKQAFTMRADQFTLPYGKDACLEKPALTKPSTNYYENS